MQEIELTTTSAAYESRRPRVWSVFLTVGLAFVTMIIASGLGAIPILLSAGMGTDPSGFQSTQQASMMRLLTSPQAIFLQMVFGQFGLLFVVLVATYCSPEKFRNRIGLLPSGLTNIEWIMTGLGAFLPAAVGMLWAGLLTIVIPADPSLANLFSGMPSELIIPWIVFIAIGPGFGEEILFRGYMQGRLLKRWRPAMSILASSLCFALFHLMPHTVVFAFPIGLWFGYVSWKTGSIWPTILGHALINGVWNTLNIAHSKWNLSSLVYNFICVFLVAIGFVAWYYSIRALRRVSRDRRESLDEQVTAETFADLPARLSVERGTA